MEKEKTANGTLQKLMKNKKVVKAILIVGIAGLALILLSELIPTSAPQQADDTAVRTFNFDDSYIRELEDKLSIAVSGIEGAGEAKVIITLEEGPANIYATEFIKSENTLTDSQTDGQNRDERQNDNESRIIIVKDARGNETPVLVKQLPPKIMGAAVFCPGAGNALVRERVLTAVSTVLGISSSRVSVIQAKPENESKAAE